MMSSTPSPHLCRRPRGRAVVGRPPFGGSSHSEIQGGGYDRPARRCDGGPGLRGHGVAGVCSKTVTSPGRRSHLRATTTPAFRKLQPQGEGLSVGPSHAGRTARTLLDFGGRLTLRFIRRLSLGTHPGLEVGGQRPKGVPHCAPVAGTLELQTDTRRTHDPRRFARVRDPIRGLHGTARWPICGGSSNRSGQERRRRPTRVASRFSGGDARAVYGAGGP